MDKEIKERINIIRQGRIPQGYRYVKDIGIAPDDWKIGKLSDVVVNKQRPAPKPKTPYWRLGIRSWAKGTFHSFVDKPETVNMDELYEVYQNDLVVNITFAWEHAIAIASEKDHGLLVSHRFPTYVFKDKYIPKYYEAVVKQRSFKDMLEHISPGGAGRNRVLNRKDFLNLPCYIPSFDEQEKIAEILTACDKLIELKEKLIEEKKRQKKCLMEKLFSDQSNYVFLSDIANLTMGQSPKSTSYNEIFEGMPLLQGNTDLIKNVSVPRFYTKQITKTCDVGDILLSVRAPVGTVFLSDINACIGRGLCAINAGELTNYLYQYLLYYEKSWSKVSQGSTFTSISTTEIAKVKVPFINNDICIKIANILLSADKEIMTLSNELNQWNCKKICLLQLLLNGIVRVNKE